MTAEIAVFNKSAVALAADSAVTISGGDGVSKIYNGADKLFALSKYHPVGIMVFGSANLCGVPWEMLIKEFRKKIKDEHCDTVGEYAQKFWDFLCNGEHLIPMDLRENYLIDTFANKFFPSLINHIDERRIKHFIDENGIKPTISETYEILEEEANSVLANISIQDYLEGFDESDIAIAREFSLPIARNICEDRLLKEDGTEIPESLCEVIGNLFAMITCKKSPFGHNTGLVFAGYGELEYMPAILAFDVHGFFQNKLRFSPNLSKSSSGGVSAIKAYAQEEEVETFLHGISWNLRGFMFAGFEVENNQLLSDMSQRINATSATDAEKEQLIRDFSDKLDERLASYNEIITSHINDNFSSKVTEMIEFLPKQDLAYMAESLVNLTAFKRKISNDNETVGGPIDVAIISKGDGFIWVKRKHYFDKELNHHYFSRIS
ncbi:MAG: hypothetical protein E6736_11395 [Leclercia adecarboxylata]|nr:hypothetical protein [Leclercia adecarboxylata]